MPTPAWWPRAWPRRTTSTCSTCASTWRSTAGDNAVFEVDTVRTPLGDDNPVGQRLRAGGHLVGDRVGGSPRTSTRRGADRGRSSIGRRSTRWVSPRRTSSCRRRLRRCWPTRRRAWASGPRFAAHNLWVTPFAEDERRAAGDYPNQHSGGAGLPEWTAQDRVNRGHRHRALALLRGHPHPPTRGLARHAGRVHGFSLDPCRVLRPQSRARRAADPGRRRHAMATEQSHATTPGVPSAGRGVPRDDARARPRRASRSSRRASPSGSAAPPRRCPRCSTGSSRTGTSPGRVGGSA